MFNSSSDFNKKEEYSDGKYSIHSFTGPTDKFRRLACSQESICVLPFDINEHEQVRNLYLSKYDDVLLGGQGVTCLTKSFDPNSFDSHFSAVADRLKSWLGLEEIDLDDVYFLGKISHGVPFSKRYSCYAINLSNYSKDNDGFTNFEFSDPRIGAIEKIRFNRVIKGEVSDSLALACSLLLLSYFSE